MEVHTRCGQFHLHLNDNHYSKLPGRFNMARQALDFDSGSCATYDSPFTKKNYTLIIFASA